jgi:hypothetical protein
MIVMKQKSKIIANLLLIAAFAAAFISCSEEDDKTPVTLAGRAWIGTETYEDGYAVTYTLIFKTETVTVLVESNYAVENDDPDVYHFAYTYTKPTVVIDVNDSHCDVPDRGTVEGDKITFTTDYGDVVFSEIKDYQYGDDEDDDPKNPDNNDDPKNPDDGDDDDDDNPTTSELTGALWLGTYIYNEDGEIYHANYGLEFNPNGTGKWWEYVNDEDGNYEYHVDFTYTWNNPNVAITMTPSGETITVKGKVNGNKMTVTWFEGYQLVLTKQ